VLSLPQAAGEGHSHEGGAEHSHEGGAALAPMADTALAPEEAEVVAALVAYHDALTTGDAAAPEPFVLADERFVMIEGKHVNRGWADYRDNHLKAELADLAKVRFRLSDYQVQVDGGLAAVNFTFNILPKAGPEMDFGSGRATAVLVRTDSGWKLQELHTS
jgi:ketosteroid isomerase-like protein